MIITLRSVIVLSMSTVSTTKTNEDLLLRFEEFKKEYNRVYSEKEALVRYKVSEQNLKLIDDLNAQENARNGSARFDIGPFVDLTGEEYRSLFLTFRFMDNIEKPNPKSRREPAGSGPSGKATGKAPMPSKPPKAPQRASHPGTKVDWRMKLMSRYPNVDNRQIDSKKSHCDPAFAFAAVDGMEIAVSSKRNARTKLSKQPRLSSTDPQEVGFTEVDFLRNRYQRLHFYDEMH